MHTYGIAPKGVYSDVSRSMRGAKRYATLNGYDQVYIRFNCGYHIALKAEKINGRWVNV